MCVCVSHTLSCSRDNDHPPYKKNNTPSNSHHHFAGRVWRPAWRDRRIYEPLNFPEYSGPRYFPTLDVEGPLLTRPTIEQCGSIEKDRPITPTSSVLITVLLHAPPPEEVWPWLCQHLLHRCEEGRHCYRSLYQTQVLPPSNDPEDNSPSFPQAGQEYTGKRTRDGRRVLVV